MIVPGGNLLNLAMTVIQKQTFVYKAYASRTASAIGQWVTTYASNVTVQGSVQPVPRTLYEQMGLDLQKSYWTFFVPRGIIDVTRDTAGDQFVYNSQTFQVISTTPWSSLDGWDEALCVLITS